MNESYMLLLFLFGTVVITALTITIVVLLVVYTRRQVQSRLVRQRLESQYREDLLHTRIEVQEQALQTVSREIHDGIGQELGMGLIQLTALRQYMSSAPGPELLQDNIEILTKSISNLRLLSHSLNTGLVIHKGLDEALATELERLRAFTSLTCDLIISGEHTDLSAEMDLLLFRVAQESIQNILKHAGATRVEVSLHYSTDDVTLRIADNGIGIGERTAPGQTLGMANMRQRADMLKGTLLISSPHSGGTVVCVTAPYDF